MGRSGESSGPRRRRAARRGALGRRNFRVFCVFRGLLKSRSARPAVRSRLLQKTSVAEPFLEARDPLADRSVIARTQAEAVSAAGIDMQLRWHARLLEPQIDV